MKWLMMIKKLSPIKWSIVLVASLWAMFSLSVASAVSVDMHHWYVGMDAGWMQTHMNQNATTVQNGSDYPPPANVDQYSLNRPHATLFDIQAGYRWNRDARWIPSYALALRYEHVFTTAITGMVTQYSDPDFTNYSYTSNVSSNVISLYSKLDFVRFNRLMLYVDLGVGISFNQNQGYSETALPNVIARYSPNYASRTNTQFAYNAGAGLEYIVTNNLIVSAGYSYQSFGNFSSGSGQNPNWGNTQIKLGRLNSNIGLIGISYLFK